MSVGGRVGGARDRWLVNTGGKQIVVSCICDAVSHQNSCSGPEFSIAK